MTCEGTQGDKQMSEQRVRAKDSDLGEIQKNYIAHLKNLLGGAEDTLSASAHAGIRGILKDNNITVDPDLTKAADHQKTLTLTLVNQEVTEGDVSGAQGY